MARLRGRARSQYVARMFGRIARRYDLLNAVMSAGRHHAWRRQAVDLAIGDLRGPALDVAAGTGDFAFELLLSPTNSNLVRCLMNRENSWGKMVRFFSII